MTKHQIPHLDIEQASHPDAKSKSFILYVARNDVDDVINSTKWPHYVKVRDYVEKWAY